MNFTVIVTKGSLELMFLSCQEPFAALHQSLSDPSFISSIQLRSVCSATKNFTSLHPIVQYKLPIPTRSEIEDKDFCCLHGSDSLVQRFSLSQTTTNHLQAPKIHKEPYSPRS